MPDESGRSDITELSARADAHVQAVGMGESSQG